jgi:hypothetical protein
MTRKCHVQFGGGSSEKYPSGATRRRPTLHNVQHDANHLHTLWRDFTNDFGQDLLDEHYAAHHTPTS